MENHSEKTLFDGDMTSTQKSLASSSPNLGQAIIITKNDSIRRRVSQILKRIEENKTVLIASKSNGIPKAISIIEIVKQNLPQSLQQYNKVTKISSKENPNHKSHKIEKATIQDPTQEATESIRGPKVYILPIMYTLLEVDDNKTNNLNGWTTQTVMK